MDDTLHLKIVIFLCLLICVDNSLSVKCEDVANPSLGDLCLDTGSDDLTYSGTVLIYYTDNFHKPRWGTICDDGAGEYTESVMCHQLGFACPDIHSEFNSSQSHIPPWLTEVECESPEIKHILRCDSKVVNEVSSGCSPLFLNCRCEGDNNWNQPPDPKDAAYQGQVWLLHSNDMIQGQQVSVGLVYVFIDKYWGTIYHNEHMPLSSYAADSLCIQLGYTQADPLSIITKNQSGSSFTKEGALTDSSWLQTNEISKCDNSFQSCFSCCFSAPTKICNYDVCSQDDSIVLRCLFDPQKKQPPPDGNKQLCELSSGQSPASCSSAPYEQLMFSFAGLFVIAMVAFIVVAIASCVLYHHLKHRVNPPGERQPLMGGVRQRVNDLQVEGDQN